MITCLAGPWQSVVDPMPSRCPASTRERRGRGGGWPGARPRATA